ncbi:MAG: GAF domain-containing protein [Anaerolineae bacterium]|nr:GAF domain-containing protein [Anaerolineae bacterium]
MIANEREIEVEALAAFRTVEQLAQNLDIGILGLVIILGVTLAIFITRSIINPLKNLSDTVEALGAGDLDAHAQILDTTEIGQLALNFNAMAGRLNQTVSSLTLATEVGRTIAQERDLDILLKSAADLIQDLFDLYYTQIYLLNPVGRRLVLRAGTGAVGGQLLIQRHSLPVDLASLNGTAAVEKRAVIVEDTESSTIHRANPLLPDTRSEMVVPLLVGDQVVGVLDMQSKIAGALSKDNLSAYEALSGQPAVAIQNVELLNETQSARAELEAQSRRLTREGWDDFLNAFERGERVGFTYDLENMTSYMKPITGKTDEHTLVKVIPVLNEPVGILKFEGLVTITASETALVDTIARQVGQQVENLRLLAQAEDAVRRLTREGWEKQLEAQSEAETGFSYDLNKITPLSASANGGDSDVRPTKHNLEILGEKIGEISVSGPDNTSKEIKEFLSTIGDQLATRVENLRLFEETERGQIELERRARQLAAVAEVSTASSRELEVETMLKTVVKLTQRQFDLYHAHIFTFDSETEKLNIVACGWLEGDENEGTHETSSISLDQEQSLVARAARTKQAVIVNDVKNEPGWRPNPLLPDTASEMAVPLVVGDEMIGVLDVQSERVEAFTEEDANIQLTLASQVATTMQNARSFALAQSQAEREATLNVISQKIQTATSVEAVLQIAARELGNALNAPMTIAQLSLKNQD